MSVCTVAMQEPAQRQRTRRGASVFFFMWLGGLARGPPDVEAWTLKPPLKTGKRIRSENGVISQF